MPVLLLFTATATTVPSRSMAALEAALIVVP
jgi:hypothetical protein